MPILTSMGYSSREIEEAQEHAAGAPWGSYFANALAFIVESLDDEGSPLAQFGSGYLRELSEEDIMEWAESYNFTVESLTQALDAFQRAVLIESKTL